MPGHPESMKTTCPRFFSHQYPKIAQERLGHSTIAQTMDTYSHVLADMQDQAAALERALA